MGTASKDRKRDKTPRIEMGLDEARQQLGSLINRAASGSERVVLTRHGLSVVALVSIDDLNSLEEREVA